VRTFAQSIDPQALKAIITPAGGEPINGSNFPDNPLRRTPQPAP
jgi:hypothetical protein